MTVGLLLCDRLDPDVAALRGDYPTLYAEAFDPTGMELRIYRPTDGDFPASVDECDGWIISGSRHCSYGDEEWIRHLHDVARATIEARVPLAGICFGHQVIARALDGEVRAADAGWGVGIRTFDVVAQAPWMQPAVESFSLLMSHADQVTRLPTGAELLATSDYCPNAAYRIDDHVFCVQGHPEWVPEVSRAVTTIRRDRIGHATADAALESLTRRPDSALVSGWIARFLSR